MDSGNFIIRFLKKLNFFKNLIGVILKNGAMPPLVSVAHSRINHIGRGFKGK